jgi:hypothetical protein
VKHIPLVNSSRMATVDDRDFDWLSRYTWYAEPAPDGGGDYVVRYVTLPGGRVRRIYMHNEVWARHTRPREQS